MTRKTSLCVYNTIKNNGLLSKRRFQVYEALFKNGPLTQMETARMIPYILDHSVTPRFAELRDMKAIEEVGERKCSITGYNTLIWDVTDNLPIKRTKKKKEADVKKIIKQMELMTEDQKKELYEFIREFYGLLF